MCVSAVFEFLLQARGSAPLMGDSFQVRWWPWPQLLSLVVTIMWALLIARLNGVAYWFTVVVLGMGLSLVAGSVLLTSLNVVEGWPIAQAGGAAWCQLLLFGFTFGLLVAKPSVRAPWALMNGFSGR